MPFSDQFLDDVRARLPVSEVVGRTMPLKRRGSREFNGAENESFTVNDEKGFYHDFADNRHGDIFGFVMETEGCTFPEAVERCAALAGVALPVEHRPADSAPPQRNGRDHPGPGGDDRPGPDDVPDHPGADDRAAPRAGGSREITRAYDYTDPQGSLIYQVCRIQWRMPDGSWEPNKKGSPKKTFLQRRPAGGGSWLWGLDAGEYIRARGGDWYKATPDRIEKWTGAERRTFAEGAQHGLYRSVEFNEEKSLESPVFIPEGEKDVDTLRDWGQIATTNSGGAGNWRPDHAETFRGLDVILPIDNDDAGRKRADIIGRALQGVARSVRVLDFAALWPGAPAGADVTDWKEQAGGTADQLAYALPSLTAWAPAPYVSKFGRVRWAEQEHPRAYEYEWWVKGIIPKRQTVAVIGAMGCGKSYETFNLGGHIALGMDYRGHRTKQGIVIFCAPEGGAGVVDRMRAYRKEHNLPLEGVPYEALTRRFNLFANDADVEGLIAEAKAIVSEWPQFDLALFIIDTWSAATTGMDENSSKDVSLIRSRILRIERECNCGVLFVHHMNAGGERQRGHSSITADVEAVLDIRMVTRFENKQQIQVTDDNDRPIRRITNFKQREAATGQHWDFVLRGVEIRRDADGDAVPSCVSTAPSFNRIDGVGELKTDRRDNTIRLTHQRAVILEALRKALSENGEPTPPTLKLPRMINTVVRVKYWKQTYLTMVADEAPADGDAEARKRFDNTINKRLADASHQFQNMKIIGRINPFAWLTSKAAGPVKVEPVVPVGEPVGDLLDEVPPHPGDVS